MSTECSRWGELAQLVAHHILGHAHFDVFPSVMNHEGHIDEFGNDRAGACPGLDGFASSRLRLLLYFEEQFRIDKRAFLATTAHQFRFFTYLCSFS